MKQGSGSTFKAATNTLLGLFLCQSCHEMVVGRIAENNIEILKQDHEKEVETLKEEAKRLKEETISLQRQSQEGEQLNADLQEQISQLTKHVRTIPDLHRELSNLQNQLISMDRRMKQASEQARGAQLRSRRPLLCRTSSKSVLFYHHFPCS